MCVSEKGVNRTMAVLEGTIFSDAPDTLFVAMYSIYHTYPSKISPIYSRSIPGSIPIFVAFPHGIHIRWLLVASYFPLYVC